MKRPFVTFTLSFVLGILWGYLSLSYNLFITGLVIGCVLILAGIWVYIAYRKTVMLLVVISSALFLVGCISFTSRYSSLTGKYAELNGTLVTAEGMVVSDPDIGPKSLKYSVETVLGGKKGRLLVTVSPVPAEIAKTTGTAEAAETFKYGDAVKLCGVIELPGKPGNPGGFDYGFYLAQKGVSGTIYMDQLIRLDHTKQMDMLDWVIYSGKMVRNKIGLILEKSLPPQQAQLQNGILTGNTAGMDPEVENVFKDSGLTHITAVSGANVAFIIFPVMFILKRLKVGKRLSSGIMILILAVFIFITGFSPSVVRAVIMAVLCLIAAVNGRESDILNSLCISAFIMLAVDPLMLFSAGFQLSYAATVSILYLRGYLKTILYSLYVPKWLAEASAVIIAAQVGVAPVSAYYFNTFSAVSFISNILTAPLLQAVTATGSMIAAAGFISIAASRIIGYVGCVFLSFILLVSKITASIPFASLSVTTPCIPAVAAYYVLVPLIIRYLAGRDKVKLKKTVIAAGMVIAVFITISFTGRGLEVCFIDVGQGDAALVRTAGGTDILIDAGGTEGKYIIVPFLLDKGVASVDMAVVTHAHTDHIKGFEDILMMLGVDNILIPAIPYEYLMLGDIANDNSNDNSNDIADSYNKADKRNDEYGKSSGQAVYGTDLVNLCAGLTKSDIKAAAELRELATLASSRGVNVIFCGSGDVIYADKHTTIEVLYPPYHELPYDPDDALNNLSLVLKLNYKNVSILFAGDTGFEAEEAIIDSGADLKSSVLKVGHHGSAGSSGEDFLNAVMPEVAVISVGSENLFGHPSASALARLRSAGTAVFRTDEDGCVRIVSNGSWYRVYKTLR